MRHEQCSRIRGCPPDHGGFRIAKSLAFVTGDIAIRSSTTSSPSSGPGIVAAGQAAVDGAAQLTGAVYIGRKTDSFVSCPSGVARCFAIESEIDGVRAAYFHSWLWLETKQAGSLCLLYTVEADSGWRFLDMTCSPPESGGPEGPDIGQGDAVGNTSGTCANVRQAAGLGSTVVGCLPAGTDVTIDGGPVYVIEANASQSRLWWHLSGKGWMAHDFLIVIWILS